jgi:pimeloyl-ACP methyl ester carboxylesterase
MQTITSSDGTRIAFWKYGVGPPLVLVHGTLADHTTTWRFVLPSLSSQFTVYAMDRRGRGGSEDSPVYDLQREAEDVACLIDSIGQPVNLLGHSHGGLCAFEAALLTPNLCRLIVYEGIPLRGAEEIKADLVERLEAMLRAGDTEGTLVTMLNELLELPREELDVMRAQQDAWAVRLANTLTMPRELGAFERYSFTPQRFMAMDTPTLLLVGEKSSARELVNARAIADALPRAEIATLAGQQHLAMYTAPDLFGSEVMRFLTP